MLDFAPRGVNFKGCLVTVPRHGAKACVTCCMNGRVKSSRLSNGPLLGYLQRTACSRFAGHSRWMSRCEGLPTASMAVSREEKRWKCLRHGDLLLCHDEDKKGNKTRSSALRSHDCLGRSSHGQCFYWPEQWAHCRPSRTTTCSQRVVCGAFVATSTVMTSASRSRHSHRPETVTASNKRSISRCWRPLPS